MPPPNPPSVWRFKFVAFRKRGSINIDDWKDLRGCALVISETRGALQNTRKFGAGLLAALRRRRGLAIKGRIAEPFSVLWGIVAGGGAAFYGWRKFACRIGATG